MDPNPNKNFPNMFPNIPNSQNPNFESSSFPNPFYQTQFFPNQNLNFPQNYPHPQNSTFFPYPQFSPNSQYSPYYPSPSQTPDMLRPTNVDNMPEVERLDTIDLNQQGDDTNEVQEIPALAPTPRPRWTREEDRLLISSWSNTSKDPITGTDQTGRSFWNAVTTYYNSHVAGIGGQPRKSSQCKDHWNKGNALVTYFAGCFKRAKNLNRSGWSDANYLEEAKSLYKQEKNKEFTLMHWWEIIKNEPKWNAEYMEENSSKRTKVSASGAYTSSSNPDCSEGSVNRSRPVGQKAAKKGKAKAVKKSEVESDFLALESKRISILEEIATSNAKLAAAKEEENFNKAMEILTKDTSHMSEEQLNQWHEVCKLLRQKYFP